MINFLILIGVLKAANQAERAADYLDDRDYDDEVRDNTNAAILIAALLLWPIAVGVRFRSWTFFLVCGGLAAVLVIFNLVWLYLCVGILWAILIELPLLAAANAEPPKRRIAARRRVS
jgi:hypothetical protein